MNHNIIILEGPDGSGKSTLAKRTNKHSTYIHGGAVRDTLQEQIECAIDQLKAAAVLSKWETVIIDRSVLSIFAYERALGNTNELDKHSDLLNEALNLMNQCNVIICLPEKTKWLKVFKDERESKGELYTGEEFMSCVYDEYEKILKENPAYIKYSYTEKNPLNLTIDNIK